MREAAGDKETLVEVAPGTPVREVVVRLVERYPGLAGRVMDERGNLKDAVSIFANGRNVRLFDGLDTRLQGDEELAVFPPVGGGR